MPAKIWLHSSSPEKRGVHCWPVRWCAAGPAAGRAVAPRDALTRIQMHALVLALWRAHRPAVLLVPHDVEEAMALADRVLVIDRGRVTAEQRPVAPRGRRSGVVRTPRTTLFGHLGLETESGVDTGLIGCAR